MPLKKTVGVDAWKIAAKNRFSRYPKAEKDADRLLPYASPQPSPTFKIKDTDKIFTIGSCFAREVDKALIAAGINVISRNGMPSDAANIILGADAVFNKYTVQSMANEMEWALNPNASFPGDDAFLQVKDNCFVDLQLGDLKIDLDKEQIKTVRDGLEIAMKNAAEADIFIATLGLAEAWFDNELGIYLNITPDYKLCQKYVGRFEHHILDYNDIYAGVEKLCSTVRSFGKPGVKFLLTVSPVALHTTFRGEDILVANTYSKAVQRAALEEYILKHDDADYFPSFETVTLTPADVAWSKKDFRHVNPYVVRRIMSSVLSEYMENPVELNTVSDDINRLYQDGDFRTIAAKAEQLSLYDLEQNAAYRVGLSLKKLKLWNRAMKVFSDVHAMYPESQDSLRNAVQAAYECKASEHAVLLAQYREIYPGDVETVERFSLELIH